MKSVNSNPQLPAIQADVEAITSRIASSPISDADVNAAISTEFVETLRSAKTGAISGKNLARLIDHTLLRADARQADFDKISAEARTHGFASVCVNSAWIARVAEALKGSSTLPIAVVGFPLGAMETTAKADETRRAIALGALEIDMVLQIGALKDGAYDVVEKDIQAVVQAAGNAPVKVILETAYLTREEIIAGCVISKRAGAAFVKTSTGFATPAAGQPSGATVENIKLMRLVVGPTMGVKASGGIRTREDALKMIAAGASRIGASASVAMVTASGGGATDGY